MNSSSGSHHSSKFNSNISTNSRDVAESGSSLSSSKRISSEYNVASGENVKFSLRWPYNKLTALALPPGLAADLSTSQPLQFLCGCKVCVRVENR